jgi:hypothetical protein
MVFSATFNNISVISWYSNLYKVDHAWICWELLPTTKLLIVISKVNYYNKGNNKITELRAILRRESQNSYEYKQTKSVNNRKTVKTVMTLKFDYHKNGPFGN